MIYSFILFSLIISMNDAFPPSKPWIKGMNLTEQILHPNTQQLINIFKNFFFKFSFIINRYNFTNIFR